MLILQPKGSALTIRRTKAAEANAVYRICRALESNGYDFDQEVTTVGVRLDIVVYRRGRRAPLAIIEVKKDRRVLAPTETHRELYVQHGVPVLFATSRDITDILTFLKDQDAPIEERNGSTLTTSDTIRLNTVVTKWIRNRKR